MTRRQPMNEERPYWQRHYGVAGGPTDKRAWRRLGLAFLVAIGVLLLIIIVGALLTSGSPG